MASKDENLFPEKNSAVLEGNLAGPVFEFRIIKGSPGIRNDAFTIAHVASDFASSVALGAFDFSFPVANGAGTCVNPIAIPVGDDVSDMVLIEGAPAATRCFESLPDIGRWMAVDVHMNPRAPGELQTVTGTIHQSVGAIGALHLAGAIALEARFRFFRAR